MSNEENTTEESLEVLTASALEIQTKAEIDVSIATAKQYPRSLQAFKQMALDMATLDEDTAEECMYALRRKKKGGGVAVIEGPSVRLAEIIASAWGNLRSGARIIADDGHTVTAQGVCHDLERNVSATLEVKRRVVDRNGRRYSPDMVTVTMNAANAIAFRNAVFKVIPKAYTNQVYQAAKHVAIGDEQSLSQRKDRMLDKFSKLGISPEEVCESVDVKGLDDIGVDELSTLFGFFTAIKGGDATIDEIFRPEPEPKGSQPAVVPDGQPVAEKDKEKVKKSTESLFDNKEDKK